MTTAETLFFGGPDTIDACNLTAQLLRRAFLEEFRRGGYNTVKRIWGQVKRRAEEVDRFFSRQQSKDVLWKYTQRMGAITPIMHQAKHRVDYFYGPAAYEQLASDLSRAEAHLKGLEMAILIVEQTSPAH